MLFDRTRHEPLTTSPWREDRARAAIDAIIADARNDYTEDGWWPIHPLDRSPERADVLKPLYYGAAGVIWAMGTLAQRGCCSNDLASFDLGKLLQEHRRDSMRLSGAPVLGYPLGDAGFLMLQWTAQPDPKIELELQHTIAANLEHPALGFAWGGAGSTLAAAFMYERTGATQWLELFHRGFEFLWQRWTLTEQQDVYLWATDLYGRTEARLSGLHGFASIVACLNRGRRWLPELQAEAFIRRTHMTVAKTVQTDGRFANWPHSADIAQPPESFLLQHCLGAPGMITCLGSLPAEPQLDSLLLAGGELVWLAGPTRKLPSLCHGCPGNGYAFLKLFERTGDEHWLVRAFSFAIHGIEQAERAKQQYGQRKYSLWTGDLGLAMYLSDCLRAKGEMPLLAAF